MFNVNLISAGNKFVEGQNTDTQKDMQTDRGAYGYPCRELPFQAAPI